MIIGVGVGVPLVVGAVACLGWWVRRQVECKAGRSRVLGPLGQYVELVERLAELSDESDAPGGVAREKGFAALGEIERRIRREMNIHQSVVGKRWISQVHRCLEHCGEALKLSEAASEAALDVDTRNARIRKLGKARSAISRSVCRLHE